MKLLALATYHVGVSVLRESALSSGLQRSIGSTAPLQCRHPAQRVCLVALAIYNDRSPVVLQESAFQIRSLLALNKQGDEEEMGAELYGLLVLN